MPASPCGSGCLPSAAATVRAPVVAARWLVLGAVLVTAFVAAILPVPAPMRARLHRHGARILLRCVGVRVEITDLRGDGQAHDGGVLVVASHVSWIDVLVLTAIAPAAFVARADLLDWGALGALARRCGVIPIARERLRELPDVVEQLDAQLRAGARVAVFPEGTTRCGRTAGRFRSALFEAAVRAEAPVQPVTVRYLDRSGAPSTEPAFVGDETIGASVRRLVRSRGGVAAVVLPPLQRPGSDRRELAERCETAVRPVLRSVGVARPVDRIAVPVVSALR